MRGGRLRNQCSDEEWQCMEEHEREVLGVHEREWVRGYAYT
jgi:hypothetical protein